MTITVIPLFSCAYYNFFKEAITMAISKDRMDKFTSSSSDFVILKMPSKKAGNQSKKAPADAKKGKK